MHNTWHAKTRRASARALTTPIKTSTTTATACPCLRLLRLPVPTTRVQRRRPHGAGLLRPILVAAWRQPERACLTEHSHHSLDVSRKQDVQHRQQRQARRPRSHIGLHQRHHRLAQGGQHAPATGDNGCESATAPSTCLRLSTRGARKMHVACHTNMYECL